MGDYQFKFPNQNPNPGGLPPGVPPPVVDEWSMPPQGGVKPPPTFMGPPVAPPTRVPDGGPAVEPMPPTRYPGGDPTGKGGLDQRPAPPTMPPPRQFDGGPTREGSPIRTSLPPVGANSMTAASNQARKIQAPRIPPMKGGGPEWYGKNAPQGQAGGFTPPPSMGLNPGRVGGTPPPTRKPPYR